ncbi:MAG: hypothetical protein J7539_09335 [Niabella sp.]|nr:hypothetical protein [Niabella sp.]
MKRMLLLLLSASCLTAASAQSEIHSSKEPLYVIDSNIVGRWFMSLNPNDIKEITVLKDTASTSIYGPAGKNGVILIKTKQPSKYTLLPLNEVLLQHNISLDGAIILIINNKPVKDTGLLKLDANNIKSVTLYSSGFDYLAAPYNAIKVVQIIMKDYNPQAELPFKKPGTIMIRGGKDEKE